MQLASKQTVWNGGVDGTVIEVEMTPETGRYLKFSFYGTPGIPAEFRWGDGTMSVHRYSTGDLYEDHEYPLYGKYRIFVRGISSIGLRSLDGQPQQAYDASILSVVDGSGQLTGSRSGAWKRCVNLERFVAPNVTWLGQRDFAYCSKLRQVVVGSIDVYYDGTFENCTSLVDFRTRRSWMAWLYVWKNCSSLTELRLGDVYQLSSQDFYGCTNLQDIWISNKTVAQIKQKARSGNIEGGYSSSFPWSANSTCRFHGTDGIVLGNGRIVT